MRLIYFIILLSPVVFLPHASAQDLNAPASDNKYVILINNDEIYIDMGLDNGICEGMNFLVYRMNNGRRVDVARLAATRVFDVVSNAKPISLEQNLTISEGDMVEVIPISETDLYGMTQEQTTYRKKKSHKLTWTFFGLGLIAGGGAGYFWNSSNASHEKYQSATIPNEIMKYRKEAEDLNKKYQILLGTSFFFLSITSYRVLFGGSDEPVNVGLGKQTLKSSNTFLAAKFSSDGLRLAFNLAF